jgi:hypothetical protein
MEYRDTSVTDVVVAGLRALKQLALRSFFGSARSVQRGHSTDLGEPVRAGCASHPRQAAFHASSSGQRLAAANSHRFDAVGMPSSKVYRLRVLRVVDSSCSAHSAGRMVISGRFSDVCAELDRMSRQEAA